MTTYAEDFTTTTKRDSGATALATAAVSVAAATSPGALVAAPAAGKQIWVYSYMLGMDAAGTVQFLSAATAKTGAIPMAANGHISASSSDPALPLFKCASAEALNLAVTGAGATATGIVSYLVATV